MSDVLATTHTLGEPIDLQRLDGLLANLRRAARDAANVGALVAAARDRVAEAPDDPEARQAARMAELRMRGAATMLAQSFAALARSHEATP